MNYLDLARQALESRDLMPSVANERNEKYEVATAQTPVHMPPGATPPSVDDSPVVGASPWDETEAKRLVADALARHSAAGWPPDPRERRRRGQQFDRIDALYLARDLDALHVAVADFLRTVDRAR